MNIDICKFACKDNHLYICNNDNKLTLVCGFLHKKQRFRLKLITDAIDINELPENIKNLCLKYQFVRIKKNYDFLKNIKVNKLCNYLVEHELNDLNNKGVKNGI